jgi:hypothetical protein
MYAGLVNRYNGLDSSLPRLAIPGVEWFEEALSPILEPD